MDIKSSVKSWLLNNIDLRYFEFISSKYTFTTRIPNARKDVISDLFPLRIEEGWNSFFELLNVPRLIYPSSSKSTTNNVKFMFFDSSGLLNGEFEINIENQLKSTIDLKKLCHQLNIFSDGTFAVFHQSHIDKNLIKGSYLTERGYVGYENKKRGSIKGYVHGNDDAISLGRNLNSLGVKSFFIKAYNVQYEFNDEFNYEFLWVNTSSKKVRLKIIDSSSNEKSYLTINPGGIKSYLCYGIKNRQIRKIIVESKLNMARPIIFKYMKNSFDVFHG